MNFAPLKWNNILARTQEVESLHLTESVGASVESGGPEREKVKGNWRHMEQRPLENV